MTGLALALVLASAVCHALWNLIAKRVGGGVAFAWLITTLSAAIYAPVGLGFWLLDPPEVSGEVAAFITGSSLLHCGYLLLLLRGYRTGDLSVVYPVARGSGPLLAAVGAIALLGERPSALALGGIVLVAVGIVALSTEPGRRRPAWPGVVWGLCIGAVIAVYTLWDKQAVGALAIPAVTYSWTEHSGRALLLAPPALRDRSALRAMWRRHRGECIAVAILSPFSYMLMLLALASSPVSYVAPVREVSILIGVVLGARVLGERGSAVRIPAAAGIVLGVVALAIG